MAACPHLQQLSLVFYTGVQPGDLSITAEMQALTALSSLELQELCDQHVPHLTQVTTLQDLNLCASYISDRGARQLATMQQLTKLPLGSDRLGAGIPHHANVFLMLSTKICGMHTCFIASPRR